MSKLASNLVTKGHRPPPPSPIGRGKPTLKPGGVPGRRVKIFPGQSLHTVKTVAKTAKTTNARVRTETVGQIFVIESAKLEYKFVKGLHRAILEEVDPNPGGPPWCACDWVQAYKIFREFYGDDYDFVAMIPDISGGGFPSFNDHHVHVFNNIVGINYDYGNYYDKRSYFDSTRLQGIAALTSLTATVTTQRLHELGHRWGAYVLFKRSPLDQTNHDDLINSEHHWSSNFDSRFSPMTGENHVQLGTHWIPQSDGTFLKKPYFADQLTKYCNLDLYLMGMLTPKEVGKFFYVDNPQPVSGKPNYYSGSREDLAVKNIEWAHGPREPQAAHSQRTFRLACIVLTKSLKKGVQKARDLQQSRIDVNNDFRKATRSRGLLDTYLYKSSYDGIHMKHHDLDTGIEPSNSDVVFWNSPDIWVRNEKDGKASHQEPLSGQDNWVYVRVRNSGTEPCGEVTVNLFQSDRSGTEFLYPQDWMWDNQHRIDDGKTIGSVPAAGKKTVCFKWDQTKVATAAQKHLCLLAEILPIHPTLTKLRYVWQDRRIAQKNVTILGPTPGSTDIAFQFTIGADTLPQRSVRIRAEQKEGTRLGEVSLDLGEKYETGEAKPRGGSVIERNGHFVFLLGGDVTQPLSIDPNYICGDVPLTLSEGEKKELVLLVKWDKSIPPDKVRLAITELNEQSEIVGGLDVQIGK